MQMILAVFCLIAIASAQVMPMPWTNLIDRDNQDVLTDVCSGHGYGSLAVGATDPTDLTQGSSILINRYNNHGVEEWGGWSYSFPGEGYNAALSVCKSINESSYVIAGKIGYYHQGSLGYIGSGFLMKIDDNGNVINSIDYFGAWTTNEVIPASDGGYYTTGMNEPALGLNNIPQAYLSYHNSNLTHVSSEIFGEDEGSSGEFQEGLCIAEMSNDRILVGGTCRSGYENYATLHLLQRNSNNWFTIKSEYSWEDDAVMDIVRVGSYAYALLVPHHSWPGGHGNSEVTLLKISINGDNISIVESSVILPTNYRDFWPTSITYWDNKLAIAGLSLQPDDERHLITVFADMRLNYISETLYAHGAFGGFSRRAAGIATLAMPTREDYVAVSPSHTRYTTTGYDSFAACDRGHINTIAPFSSESSKAFDLTVTSTPGASHASLAIQGEHTVDDFVDIYAVNGRKVAVLPVVSTESNRNSQIESEFSFDTSELRAGLYFIRIKIDENLELGESFLVIK